MIEFIERVRLLKTSNVFSEVSIDDLMAVAQQLQESECFSSDVLFEHGDLGDIMYFIVAGRVGISIDSDSKDKYLAVMEPGDYFGELNLLDHQPRSATATALEDCKFLTLNRECLHGLILSHPEISLGIMRTLSHKLRATNDVLLGL